MAMRRGRGFLRTTSLIPFSSGQEFKFYDTEVADVPITVAGVIGTPDANPEIQSLNLVEQGTQATFRVGRKITITSIFVKAFIRLLETSAEPSIAVRVILYQDMQCNGTGLARLSDLIDNEGGAPAYLGYINLANRGRFRILSNKLITLNAGAISLAQPVDDDDDMDDDNAKRNKTNYAGASRTLTISVPRTRIPVEISGTGKPTITSVTSNNIGMVYMASHDSAVVVTHSARIRFSDK